MFEGLFDGQNSTPVARQKTPTNKSGYFSGLFDSGNEPVDTYKPPMGTFKMKDFLGGGEFNLPANGVLNKSPRAYANEPVVGGSERDHIIPVGLGGTSNPYNLQIQKGEVNVPGAPAGDKDIVENQAIRDYKAGKINLAEARLLVMKAQQEQKGLSPIVNPNNPLLGNSYLGRFVDKGTDIVKKYFPQTYAAESDIAENPFNLPKNQQTPKESIEEVAKSFIDAIANQIKEEKQRLKDYFLTWDKDTTVSGKISQNIKAATGAANVAFSPISGLFEAANKIPIIGTISKLITLPFALAGDVGQKAASEALNKMPINSEAKKNLQSAIDEIGTLAGQIVIGGTIHAKGSEFLKGKIAELTPKFGEEGAKVIVEKAQEKAAATDPNSVRPAPITEEHTPQHAAVADTYFNDTKEAPKPLETLKPEEQAQHAGTADKYFGTQEAPKQAELPLKTEERVKPTETVPTEPQAPLIEEAKKYKSADEFIKSQGEPLYHGTRSGVSFDKFDSTKAGTGVGSNAFDQGNQIYLTENPHAAQYFADSAQNAYELRNRKDLTPLSEKPGNVLDFYLSKDAKIKDLTDMPRGINSVEAQKLLKELKDQGYDAVRFPDKGFNTVEGLPREKIEKIFKNGNPPNSTIILNPDKLQSKSQLTDIYNQAHKATEGISPKETTVGVDRAQLPVGEGEQKVSRLEARVKDTLDNISQETIDKLGLSTYEEMNKKENIAKASAYVLEDPERALKVLSGEIQAPKDILRNSIYVAMQNMAEGNVDLARKLASIGSTRMGQEIGILTEIDPNSPVKIMGDTIKFREQALEKKTGKSVNKLKKETIDEIKQERKKTAPKAADWNSFIFELTCT